MVIVIFWLMKSLFVWPKVITLSGFYCISFFIKKSWVKQSQQRHLALSFLWRRKGHLHSLVTRSPHHFDIWQFLLTEKMYLFFCHMIKKIEELLLNKIVTISVSFGELRAGFLRAKMFEIPKPSYVNSRGPEVMCNCSLTV